MQETLKDFNSTVSINGRTINNLRFADDIVLTGGIEKELQGLIAKLDTRAKACDMEMCLEKS